MIARQRQIDKLSLSGNTLYFVLLTIIAVLFVVFSTFSRAFFSIATIMNIARQSAGLALVSIGMMFIVLSRGIDLSVGGVVAVSGAVAATFVQMFAAHSVMGGAAGIVLTLATAVLLGLFNGFAVGYFGISPFIVTLAMSFLTRGLTLTLTNSQSINIRNEVYNFIGQRNIGIVPVSLLVVILAFALSWFILAHTTFGRQLYALGDNPVAARASGIDVRRHTVLVYGLAGFFIGMGAIILTGRTMSAQAMAGIGMEFRAITAVVIGGTSLLGGQGKLRGTALGLVLTAMIFTGLSMMNIKPGYIDLINGLLIIGAVVSNSIFVDGGIKPLLELGFKKPIGAVEETNEMTGTFTTLTLRSISKTFPGVVALDDVSLDITRGKVHVLCGENGAGKSTLIKVLSGVYTKDGGEILLDGKPVTIASPKDSERIGISVIYQEPTNIPVLSVSQNVNLGKEIVNKSGFLLDNSKMARKTEELLGRFNLNLDTSRKIDNCTIGAQQMVEISKAFASNAWIIVMDEPTSAISETDKNILFTIIRELKALNIAIVYITHRMSEIFEIADEISVLRDGKLVTNGSVKEYDESTIIRYMVGRELSDIFTREKRYGGEVMLEVDNLEKRGVFEPISFRVKRGEVLGFCGLTGAGRTEIMRCLFGLDKPDGGEIRLEGKRLDIRKPKDAIDSGIVLVSEDRRREGIVPYMTIRENISLPALPVISTAGVIQHQLDFGIARRFIELLSIRTPSTEQLIRNLSGGNQQKACLAKWLNLEPRLIILDEPTRGIDVGAKEEVHKLIDKLCSQGMAIILISSEMPEILGASDRIIVLYEGRVSGEFEVTSALDQETLMKSAAGIG